MTRASSKISPLTRLKVAIDARLLGTTNTGDTAYWRGLVRALFERADEVELLLYSNSEFPANVPAEWKKAWRTVNSSNSRWWSWVAFPLAARRDGCDVVHTQYNVSPLAKNPVLTIHDVSFFVDPSWFKPRDAFLLRSFVPRSARRAKRILAVSETTKVEIEKFIPGCLEKTMVTYNALGTNIGKPADDPAPTFEKYGIKQPYVMTLSMIWPRKNMQLAVEAVRHLPTDLPHQLVLVGKAGWGELQPNERTITTGYVPDEDLATLYHYASLYLCPSLHEGFGVPVIEAFACGCPVLCSPGGALPEIAGDAACVAPDFEVETWSSLIESLLRDSGKLNEMRARGRTRANDFDWSESARRTIQAYRDAAS